MHPPTVPRSPASREEIGRLLNSRCRQEILLALLRRSRTVTPLAEALGVERTQVSHELAPLARALLVEQRRRGRFHEYRLGRCVAVRFEGACLVISATAACGSMVSWAFSAEASRGLDLEGPRAEPAANGAAVTTRPASAPAPPVNTRPESRPPSAP